MISSDGPIASSRNAHRGQRHRLTGASRRLWPVSIVAALALGTAAWVGLQAGPDWLYGRAQAEARAGRFGRAAAYLGWLDRLRSPTPYVRLLRAQVAGARGQTDAAVAELSAIPDAHVLAPLARLSAGQLEARRGRLRPAEAAFLAALLLNPRAVQARRELVYIYSVQQRLTSIDAHLDALSEMGELDLTHLLHWGMIRHSEWAAGTDISALERYVAADAEDRHSRLALAEAQLRTGRADEALKTLAPLPESDPEARAARARLALQRTELEVAETLLAGGPADDPALVQIRGQLALGRGEYREAVRHFRVALAARPGDHALIYNMAIALSAAHDATAAEPYWRAFRRHDELGKLLLQVKKDGLEDSTLPRRIGEACIDAGRPLEGRAWLNHALARSPLDTDVLAALHRLDRIASTGGPPASARP